MVVEQDFVEGRFGDCVVGGGVGVVQVGGGGCACGCADWGCGRAVDG